MSQPSRTRARLCALVLSLGAASLAHAVSTRSFTLDSAGALSAGKMDGTAVLSTGAVIASVSTKPLPLENVGVARCLLQQKDGSVLVGTGNDGKIFKVVGDAVRELAATQQLLVTDLEPGPSGVVYASTLPSGKIFALDASGALSEFVTLPDVKHIWALAYDPAKRTLFAATGPEGKIFAIDGKGNADVYYDATASHIMALARDADGRLYAGTSDEALLLRLEGPGRADVLYDFEGNEVTALALANGKIAVAANAFPKGPPKRKSSSNPSNEDDKKDQTGEKADQTPKPGKGQLWVVEASGRARRLWNSDNGHITTLEWTDGDAIYAATGKEGHIYRVQPDGTHALWIDVDERQVLDMQLEGAAPIFITGDAGGIHRVVPGPARDALWTSKVLDAGVRARFGELSFRGKGGLSFQTRSGNTDKPDASWSEWSSVLTRPGPIRSPAARFLQLRARLQVRDGAQATASVLYAVTAFYLPDNQAPTIQEVNVAQKPGKGSKPADKASAQYQIDWKVDNPDKDALRYRLYFRPEDRDLWRPILRDSEVLTSAKYTWDTHGIPDGHYRVRVDASDELDNPDTLALAHSAQSEPFLLDNHPPRVEGLRYAGGRVLGSARDDLGPIDGLEYALDGEDWKPMHPRDGLFDTRVEAFELQLPKLEPGAHVVAVRARDARSNQGSAELWVRVP